MEDNVKKELDCILTMVNNWKQYYMRLITGENDECLLEDFLEELDVLHVYPFIYRMLQVEHITASERNVFMVKCYEHVGELRDAIEKARLE